MALGPVQIGQQGERWVVNALRTAFPSANTHPTGQNKCGDISFTYCNKTFMFEVKNYHAASGTVKGHSNGWPIQKFFRDLANPARQYDAGVLISLWTTVDTSVPSQVPLVHRESGKTYMYVDQARTVGNEVILMREIVNTLLQRITSMGTDPVADLTFGLDGLALEGGSGQDHFSEHQQRQQTPSLEEMVNEHLVECHQRQPRHSLEDMLNDQSSQQRQQAQSLEEMVNENLMERRLRRQHRHSLEEMLNDHVSEQRQQTQSFEEMFNEHLMERRLRQQIPSMEERQHRHSLEEMLNDHISEHQQRQQTQSFEDMVNEHLMERQQRQQILSIEERIHGHRQRQQRHSLEEMLNAQFVSSILSPGLPAHLPQRSRLLGSGDRNMRYSQQPEGELLALMNFIDRM